MTYIPKVNDYVIWKNGVEGWVYFKDKEYITIEVSVRPKDDHNYYDCPIHRNERLLVLCFPDQWNELKYLKSTKSVYEEQKNNMEIVGKITGREGIQK